MRDGTAAEIVELALTPKPELMIYAGGPAGDGHGIARLARGLG